MKGSSPHEQTAPQAASLRSCLSAWRGPAATLYSTASLPGPRQEGHFLPRCTRDRSCGWQAARRASHGRAYEVTRKLTAICRGRRPLPRTSPKRGGMSGSGGAALLLQPVDLANVGIHIDDYPTRAGAGTGRPGRPLSAMSAPTRMCPAERAGGRPAGGSAGPGADQPAPGGTGRPPGDWSYREVVLAVVGRPVYPSHMTLILRTRA